MQSKYAGPELYNLFESIHEPLSWNTLYNIYGITDHATEFSNSCSFYYLSSEHWLEQVPSEKFSDTLYDSTNGKYFIKGYLNSIIMLNRSSWFTINQLANALFTPRRPFPMRHDGMSPTNKLSERQIYPASAHIPVIAIQYDRDPSGVLYYYVHPDHIYQENLGWHTEAELLQLGYVFE